ncbi:hypothetical protein [Saccharomonospora cyanea]|uniref:hypothetical protein n=1 Tax=Saccharomonospora cyanea TaxID=40989 RepID=UPI000694B6F5|nr:hypothetical protein [Saccharomonospora cyanea]
MYSEVTARPPKAATQNCRNGNTSTDMSALANRACSCGGELFQDILPTCDKGFEDTGAELDLLPYEVYEPDEFFILIDGSAPSHVRTATRQQTEYWSGRRGRAPLAKYLAKAGCPGSRNTSVCIRVSSHFRATADPSGPLTQ